MNVHSTHTAAPRANARGSKLAAWGGGLAIAGLVTLGAAMTPASAAGDLALQPVAGVGQGVSPVQGAPVQGAPVQGGPVQGGPAQPIAGKPTATRTTSPAPSPSRTTAKPVPSASPSKPGTLPKTGDATTYGVAAGLSLLIAGGAVVASSRRRPSGAHSA